MKLSKNCARAVGERVQDFLASDSPKSMVPRWLRSKPVLEAFDMA